MKSARPKNLKPARSKTRLFKKFETRPTRTRGFGLRVGLPAQIGLPAHLYQQSKDSTLGLFKKNKNFDFLGS